jgi:Cft2 family RNA processing exonuclease
MAELRVLGSSSSGNCYLLECKDETLILECGIDWNVVLENVEDFSKVVGVCVSHSHG